MGLSFPTSAHLTTNATRSTQLRPAIDVEGKDLGIKISRACVSISGLLFLGAAGYLYISRATSWFDHAAKVSKHLCECHKHIGFTLYL